MGMWVSFQGEEGGDVSTHMCLAFYNAHKRDCNIQPSVPCTSRQKGVLELFLGSQPVGAIMLAPSPPGLGTRGVSLLSAHSDSVLSATALRLYASMLDAFARSPCKKACAILHPTRRCPGCIHLPPATAKASSNLFFPFFFASLVDTDDDKRVVFQFVFFNVHLITSEIEYLSMNRLFVSAALFFLIG